MAVMIEAAVDDRKASRERKRPECDGPLVRHLRRLGPASDELPAPDPPSTAGAAGDVGEHDRHPQAGSTGPPFAAVSRSSANGSGPADALPENLRVVSPKVWPGFGRPLERRFNRAWLVRQLRPLIEELPEPPVAITTLPTAADLVGTLPVGPLGLLLRGRL